MTGFDAPLGPQQPQLEPSTTCMRQGHCTVTTATQVVHALLQQTGSGTRGVAPRNMLSDAPTPECIWTEPCAPSVVRQLQFRGLVECQRSCNVWRYMGPRVAPNTAQWGFAFTQSNKRAQPAASVPACTPQTDSDLRGGGCPLLLPTCQAHGLQLTNPPIHTRIHPTQRRRMH